MVSGNVQDHETQRGARRQSPDPAPPFKNINSGSCSAFRPVKPRRFQTVAPSSATKIIKERPFFEDIKIIARGFGEIIEFPDRRPCGDSDDERLPGYPQREDSSQSRSTRLSQDLTKAATGRGARRIRKRNDRRATIQTAESLFSDIATKDYTHLQATSELNIPVSINPVVDQIPLYLGSSTKVIDYLSAGELSSDIDAEGFENFDRIMSTSGVLGGDAGKIERMLKYKEERRKQQALASQATASTRLQR